MNAARLLNIFCLLWLVRFCTAESNPTRPFFITDALASKGCFPGSVSMLHGNDAARINISTVIDVILRRSQYQFGDRMVLNEDGTSLTIAINHGTQVSNQTVPLSLNELSESILSDRVAWPDAIIVALTQSMLLADAEGVQPERMSIENVYSWLGGGDMWSVPFDNRDPKASVERLWAAYCYWFQPVPTVIWTKPDAMTLKPNYPYSIIGATRDFFWLNDIAAGEGEKMYDFERVYEDTSEAISAIRNYEDAASRYLSN